MKIKRDEAMAQLATRIPKSLHQRLKFHCVEEDIALGRSSNGRAANRRNEG